MSDLRLTSGVEPSGSEAVGNVLTLDATLRPKWAANGGSLPSVIVKASGDVTGATDPTNIQNAINAILPGGGRVGLYGKFYLASGVTTYPGVGLVGDGFGSPGINAGGTTGTTLNAVAALNSPMVTCVLNNSYLTRSSFPNLSDLVLVGTHAQTSQDGIYVTAVNGDILDMRLERVGIFDMGRHGLYLHDAQTKTWVDGCYFENCQGCGIRCDAGILQARGCYIYGNQQWGIDATSGTYIDVADNWFWSNALGGIFVWSVVNGALIRGNGFKLNGDATHPVVYVNSMGSGSTQYFRTGIIGNNFYDTRGASAAQYFVLANAGMDGSILDNSFLGQKTGNPAVKVNAHAANNILIRNNQGFNAVGLLTNPLDTTNNRCGLAGTVAVPVASTDYKISEVDQFISLSGGSGLSITIKDPGGNIIQSGLSTLTQQWLPVGFSFNGGAFTGSPTVTAWAN